jgi:hypothetical protein
MFPIWATRNRGWWAYDHPESYQSHIQFCRFQALSTGTLPA